MEKNVNNKEKIKTIIGALLCVLLVPILIINLSLIVSSVTNKEEVPSVGGHFPMIVLTDSMYPEIHSGDLIICHTTTAEEVEIGDVITFFDPMGNGTTVVTHRVMNIEASNGEYKFTTKGDANNVEDQMAVEEKDLIGEYLFRIPAVGNIVMFMQTTTGLILCVGIPLVALVVYDAIRRRKYEKEQQVDTKALMAELEALKAEKAKRDSDKE